MISKKVKALTFDTGGTILDWHTGFRNGFEKIKIKYNFSYNSADLANLMRRKSLEIVTNQKDRLVNFDYAHKIAVEEINKQFSLGLHEEDIFVLSYDVPSKLKTWNDFIDSFNELKEKFLCVSFTLLSNRLVFLNSKNNFINWDLILSCETLETYKPNVEAYLKTAKLLQLHPSECGMVACHSFDLNAAKKAGFKTYFIKRIDEWGKNTKINVDGEYDLVVSSFDELKDELY